MDYPQSWYRLALKLSGVPNPVMLTNPDNLSYADFTYSYTTSPTIKALSNDQIILLSATASATDADVAEISLENPLSFNSSTTISLPNFSRPFFGAVTTISHDGSSTVNFPMNAGAKNNFNSVPLDITPNAGTIDVLNISMDNSGNYPAQWTETGTGVATANHTIGNLQSNTQYAVSVDNTVLAKYTANSSGQILFNYTGGYSTHTFSVSVISSDATVSTKTNSGYTVSALSGGAGTISEVEFATPKATFLNNLNFATGSILNTTSSSLSDPIVSGNILVNTAQDATTTAAYTITVNPAPVSGGGGGTLIYSTPVPSPTSGSGPC